MTNEKSRPDLEEGFPAEIDHIDALLDEALRQTFPASDPIAISVPKGDAMPSAERTPAQSAHKLSKDEEPRKLYWYDNVGEGNERSLGFACAAVQNLLMTPIGPPETDAEGPSGRFTIVPALHEPERVIATRMRVLISSGLSNRQRQG